MKVILVHDALLPVQGYGGTERVIWWLAKGLSELGIQVGLACRKGSRNAFGPVYAVDFSKPIEQQLPPGDIWHFFNTPDFTPSHPYMVTIEGNGKAGERFHRDTAFVSRNHAERHGAVCFVYNGLDPADYRFQSNKERHLLFLAKASWRVKNVRGAIRMARQARHRLEIVGGKRWLFNRWNRVHWRGTLGGEVKADAVARAKGLLFPVLWDEPFGISVTEALISGTPVLATPFGSLPELVAPDTGAICHSESEFVEAIGSLDKYRAEDCRAWAMEKFTYRTMAKEYLALYRRVLSGEPLNPSEPICRAAQGETYSLPFSRA